MGTDYVELFDRGTAELIILASEEDLATFVESRTSALIRPPVWHEYYDQQNQSFVGFPESTAPAERLNRLLVYESLTRVKIDLIHTLCISDWLRVDYWGCSAELFGPEGPPNSKTWEQFLAPLFGGKFPMPDPVVDEDGTVLYAEGSGLFLLTSSNTEAMILSLKAHRGELQIMGEAEIDKLVRWHHFCLRHSNYCVLYQIDF